MSLTKEALQHIEESHKTGTEAANGDALLVGSGFELIDLEKYRDLRRRFRGTFKTQGLEAFTGYLAERAAANTPVFIDRERMAAKCYLDIGIQDAPGHCEHSAILNLPETPEFEAFHRANGSTFDQDGIVELLEDWGHLMEFANSKGESLEYRTVLHAFRNVSIDDLTSIDSEKQEHSSQVGVMNKVTVKHSERLPATITWRFSPYEGLMKRELSMRVATITKGGPSFRLRAMALEAVEKDIAEEFSNEIVADLDNCECLLGIFNP
ncbi:YfdQ family protein [Halomonas elongata]|uniref:DUF2303 family protein n=1 Tax=Halomonas elongata (strain ATCC 33173 / DSM 2581 / NBRC 15536 / NCIMB 2198 / 1H9) TaxID=768066 RepID=E1V365_HALED|nr:DUF2303 family protein [Halomonas elongata]WBF19836.1 YfdQ family protein [Halomonas elongata]WPU48706.1 DUF2303 family protein [Halomonas elongata DSM 2581]CBV42544.1 YfdQ family protein [Halomonas elongata DSM 2581]